MKGHFSKIGGARGGEICKEKAGWVRVELQGGLRRGYGEGGVGIRLAVFPACEWALIIGSKRRGKVGNDSTR